MKSNPRLVRSDFSVSYKYPYTNNSVHNAFTHSSCSPPLNRKINGSRPMASVTGSSIALAGASLNFTQNQVASKFSNVSLVSVSVSRKGFQSLKARRFSVSCVAKPETVDKVCAIVKKQLALPEGTSVTGESKFASLGADSLDTVEIVMGLEEEFGISVEEESAQTIATVQDAADLIEKLLESK